MGALSFLSKVTVVNEKQVASKALVSKKPTEGADLRIYHTGAAYPSEQFTKDFGLEYAKDKGGNGLDIFKSSECGAIKSEDQFIVITAVNRRQAKIDLFKTCNTDESGVPQVSVLTQAPTTFGKKELIPMLKEVYGIELDKDTKPFVDLKVVGGGDNFNEPWMNSNGSDVYHIPKKIAYGDDKDKLTTVRREKLLLWALVPFSFLEDVKEPIILSGPAYNEPTAEDLAKASADIPEDEKEEFEESFIPEASTDETVADTTEHEPLAIKELQD